MGSSHCPFFRHFLPSRRILEIGANKFVCDAPFTRKLRLPEMKDKRTLAVYANHSCCIPERRGLVHRPLS